MDLKDYLFLALSEKFELSINPGDIESFSFGKKLYCWESNPWLLCVKLGACVLIVVPCHAPLRLNMNSLNEKGS